MELLICIYWLTVSVIDNLSKKVLLLGKYCRQSFKVLLHIFSKKSISIDYNTSINIDYKISIKIDY